MPTISRYPTPTRASSLLLGLSLWALACSSDESSGNASGAGGSTAGTGPSTAGGTTATAGGTDGGGVGASGGSAAAGSAAASSGSAGDASGGSGASAGQSAGGSGGSGGIGGGSGGSTNAGGTSGGAGSGSGGSGGVMSSGKCGVVQLNQYPFGCKLGWGGVDSGSGSLAQSASFLQFMAYWVDSTISPAGKYTTCNGCNWIKNKVASTNLIPVYYGYIIGFLAHANGIVDGNQQGGKKLTTDGAALVKANRAAIIDAYAWYARESAKVWPTKPLVWLMEGDLIQLVDKGQSSPMSYAEMADFTAEITCAIKSNMPNAVVALNHSTWNGDQVTNDYWGALKVASYDLVWTTGLGNTNGYLEASGSNPSYYNHATATYSYLHQVTGRNIIVDTSNGISAAGDSWSTTTPDNVNSRIADGVVGLLISGSTPNASNVSKFSGVNALPGCQ